MLARRRAAQTNHSLSPNTKISGTRYSSAAITLVLSFTWLAWPATLLQASIVSQQMAEKANAPPCASCQAKAEQLRAAAELLIKKATYDDLKKAVAQLEESARLFQSQSRADSARNYVKVGEIYTTWSRYKPALRMYQKALSFTSVSDIDLRCSILSHMVITSVDLSDGAKVDDFSKQAKDLSESTSNPGAKAEYFEAIGRATYLKEPGDALESFRSAIELFRVANDSNGQARASLYAGHAYFHSKNLGGDSLADAFSAYSEALRLWTSVNNIHGMAQAHQAMALYWLTTGDHQKAMIEYGQAQPIFRVVGDRDSEAIFFNGLGGASRSIGNYEDSLGYYKKARAAFAEINDLVGEIAAIDGAAQAEWALHRPAMMRQLNETKLRLAIRAHHPRFQASAMAGLAYVDALRGNYKSAESLYLHGLAVLDSQHEIGKPGILIPLGRLYSAQKRDDQALVYLRKGLELAESHSLGPESARAHFEIATVYQHQSRLEDAKDEAEKVLQVIESQRIKVSDFDDRASYFASVHEYYQLYIEILMQLDEQHPDQGFARQAFEAAEKSKVRSLLDMLGFVPSALTLSQIQGEIQGDDTVLLEYALGKEHSYLWVVDEAGITSYEVSNSTSRLSQLVDNFRSSLLARGILIPEETASHFLARVKQGDRRYGHDQQELAKALLGPAVHSLNRQRVIIVADGFLQYVPFAALIPPDRPDRSQATANPRELVSLPSAFTLRALRDAALKRPSPPDKIAVFADAVFEPDDARLAHSSSSLRKPEKPVDLRGALRDVDFRSAHISRLTESHAEAEAIAKAFGKENVFRAEGFDATRETALRILGRYQFIHFATHGLLDTRHPGRSGLVLTLIDNRGKPLNGFLRLKDIYQLKLSADLVVLSSCDSALGRDLESEGMIGLTRAFLYAGSSRIVSSLWKVDDRATAKLMKHFYRRLHNGESPGLALRGAQSDLAADPEWKLPYYWAAFVLQGEYRWADEIRP